MSLSPSNRQKPKGLGTRAYEHVRYIADEIGPRPAGSAASSATREYISQQLSAWGYRPEPQPIRYAQLPKFDWLLPLTGLTLSALSWWMLHVPWLSIFLPFIGAAVPQLSRWLITKRPVSELDFNIIAGDKNLPDAPTLYLCAHFDSAPASVFNRRWIRLIQTRLFDIFQRVAVAISIFSLLALLQLPFPAWLLLGLRIASVIAGLGFTFLTSWEQIAPDRQYSPGANDNASGVAVLLALAEYYGDMPPQNLQLSFLFTAAEETGMHGARSFAQDLSSIQDNLLGLINVDMVGTGDEIRVVSSDGTLRPVASDARLNKLIFQANLNAGRVNYTLKSGDFLPFLQNNIPATSIEVAGSIETQLAYHSRDDRIDRIQLSALELTLGTLENVIHRLDHLEQSNGS